MREFASRADAQLGENLAQVVLDSAWADEQLFANLVVGQAFLGKPGDLEFLRGQVVAGVDRTFASGFAGRHQLAAGPVGEPVGSHRGEHLLGYAQLGPCVDAPVLAPQPLAVDQMPAIVLLTLGHLDDAGPSLSESLRQARTQRNQMAVQLLTQLQALSHLAAGRLETARNTVESLPEQERMTWTRIGGRVGLTVLARIAAHTNDRSLLRETAIHARDAYTAGGPGHRREAMSALAHIAWQRGDIQEAQRWLTDDFTLVQTPLWATCLDNVVLAARVAAAAGDAGLSAQVLHAAKILTREEPGAPLFNAVAQHARALLERDPDALVTAAKSLSELSRPLLHAPPPKTRAPNLRAPTAPRRVSTSSTSHSKRTCAAARPPMPIGSAKSFARTAFHDAWSASRARRPE